MTGVALDEKWKLETEWLGDDLRNHMPISVDGENGHLAFAQAALRGHGDPHPHAT